MVIDKERIVGQEDVETKKAGEMMDVQSRDKERLPDEVKTWMRKFEEEDVGMKNQQIRDDGGQVVMTSVGDDDVKLKLPVSRKIFSTGFSLAINKAGRWLSEFLFRWIKIKKTKVEFKEDDEF